MYFFLNPCMVANSWPSYLLTFKCSNLLTR
jgi:hypothetical protein